MMNIETGNIVFNLLNDVENSPYKVGEYVEKYDVRVMEEMITGKNFAQVMYIDDDGAIITNEFGPYAYPADALRLVTEEEVKLFEEEKYLLYFDFKGEKVKAPVEIAKAIVDDNYLVGIKNLEGNDLFADYVYENFDKIMKEHKEFFPVLVSELCETVHKRQGNRRSYTLESLIVKCYTGRNAEAKSIIEENLFATPVCSSEFYRAIECKNNSILEIPLQYAEIIEKKSDYKIALLYKGMLLSELLESENISFDFPHFNRIKVDRAGVDVMYRCYPMDFVRRAHDYLNFDMETLMVFLGNPKRDFSVGMSKYFMELSWEEITNNKQLFSTFMYDICEIESRVARGKYVDLEFVAALFAGNRQRRMWDLLQCKKSEIKLKDVLAHLESIEGEIPTFDDLAKRDNVSTKRKLVRPDMTSAVSASPFIEASPLSW